MFSPERAARALLDARTAGRPAGPLPADIAPQTIAEGAATQMALAGLLSAVPPGGFKIGAIARRMQDNLGISAPIAGFMRAADIHSSGVSLPFARYRGVAVECEVAVRLGHDLPPAPCDAARAADAVAEMFAAIEIVENRYGPPPAGNLQAVGVPTLLADQMFHAACVIGAPAAWRGLDLQGVEGRMLRDGVDVDSGYGRDLMGHPLNALAWLAGSPEAAAFGGLRAGQVIMLGSVTPPLWLDAPARIRVAFAGMPPVDVALI
jgi:2-keto-4-pentenoate hydratase